MSGQSAQNRIGSALAAGLPEALRTKTGFGDWYFPLLCDVQVAAVELHDFVARWLDREKEQIAGREHRTRDVWFLFPEDASRLTKGIDSLLAKLGRDMLDEPPGRCLTPAEVENRIRGMPDLARFRIVCDFASDADYLLSHLLVDSEECKRISKYRVPGTIKDYVYDLSLRRPTRGHRARQLAVAVPTSEAGRPVLVEIQIMTLLQHAWDRRNHPVYEWTRCGRELPAQLVVNDVALAETLHMVDRQAAENWQEFLRISEEEA